MYLLFCGEILQVVQDQRHTDQTEVSLFQQWHAVSLNMYQSRAGLIWSLQEELTCKDFPLQSADLNPTEHLFEKNK